ncbi:MAG TPA: hypothetical protein C5S51_07120 [Methanosarcinaceae archaeon]|nr:hypothetical protein [Methanosarcinaceae archaeon]
MIPLIIILYLILLVIGLIVGFLQLELIDKKINGLENWFHKKKLEGEIKDISGFSFKKFIEISSSIVAKIFECIDKIEDARLKIGIKIDSLIILTSITLAITYFLMLFIVAAVDLIPLYMLVIILIFSFGLLLGFVKIEFADSINSRVENWCLNKNSEYKTKDIKRLSRDGIVKLFSFVVIKIFKYIDKIQDSRLKAGIKIVSLILVISITISLIILLISAAVILLVAVVYLVLFVIALYVLYKIIQLWGRYEYEQKYGKQRDPNDGRVPNDGRKYDQKTNERIIKQDGRTYRNNSLFGWKADTDIFGNDKVDTDVFGNPEIDTDVFGNQKIETDILSKPIVPPIKKK